MAEINELKKIKKKYGENFMKLCRELFPTILEKDGRLYEILTSTFSNNCKTLYEDLTKENLQYQFKDFIYSKVDVETPEIKMKEEKTPYELLEEAGYDLYECKTNEEIQKFKKYYAPGEELCTFSDENRLDREIVFFAVKKDAENIKRENFEKPKREDEYGTSVMGIQFSKNGICTVSIKNRYNHRVNNPDSTYGNDLNKIIPGLTESFGKLLENRGLKLNNSNIERFSIPGYTVANDGKYYKYNMEINGTYYCPGNVKIKDGEVQKIENLERKMLIDYFVLDLENKTLEVSDKDIKDSFPDEFKGIEKIEIEKEREKEKGTRRITIQKKAQEDPIIIEIDRNNQIIGYRNKRLKKAGYSFLRYNKALTELDLPNLSKAGDGFLYWNSALTELNLPNLSKAGDDFLLCNGELTKLNLQNLEEAGNNFLRRNNVLTELNLPNLSKAGNNFLRSNKALTEINLPNLSKAGDGFLHWNSALTELNLPNLSKAGDGFLYWNSALTELNLPNLSKAGDDFLFCNGELTKLNLQNLEEAGDDFLRCNKALTEINLPNLSKAGDGFLYWNSALTELNLPNLEKAGDGFLHNNGALTKLEVALIKKISKIIKKGLKKQKTSNIIQINHNDIANLDRNNKITTSETNFAKIIIEKLKTLFKGTKDQR